MKFEEAMEENDKRYWEERRNIFPGMLKDLNTLTLKRIQIQRKNINNHENVEIDNKKFYLTGFAGRWYICKPLRNYWDTGWEFDLGWSYINLNSIDFLFEIENLDQYNNEPLGRVEVDESNGHWEWVEDE